jgi:hypothetical protein
MFGLVAAATGGLVLGLALSGRPSSTAMAQIPDQGAQLLQLIDQSKALNAKMDRLLALLEGGKLEVHFKTEDAKPAR